MFGQFERKPRQHPESAYTRIKPCFYGHPSKLTCDVEQLNLVLTIALFNPMPADKPGVQLLTASVAGRHIGDCEMYGSDIEIRINNRTNSFEILVSGAPVMQSSAPTSRPR